MKQFILLAGILFFTGNISNAQAIKIKDQSCEHLSSPLGIDNPHPRFSWKMQSAVPGIVQQYYEVIAGTDSAAVVLGTGNVWQSGKINSGGNLAIYKGRPLQPFTKYYWRIKVITNQQVEATGSVTAFETGMMSETNWQGNWISDNQGINVKPAPFFRKEFSVPAKIIAARAYITAAGLYELYINGIRVGDHQLDPMFTRFDRRNLYVTYDVTAYLTQNKNAIGIVLGNGWYNFQSMAVWDYERAPWRNRPAFCFDLRITYENGVVETISSNKSWKTSTGPVIYNSIYTGEHYNASKEFDGWSNTGFDDSKWNHVINRQAPSGNIVAQVLQPIRYTDTLQPVSIKQKNDSTWLFDIGRNIAGITQIKLNGDSNTVVKVVHAERLDKNGNIDQSNVDYFLRNAVQNNDPFATDIYYLSGKGPQIFKPHFDYKGFRYIEVRSNKPLQLIKSDLVAYFMHSDVAPVGNVVASNDLINKIYAATNASYLSNLFGYPTDCPQREKNGWTGDAHIASETGLYNFDAITIYEKWLADMRDEQQPNGVLPSIVPTDGWGYEWGNGPDWTSAVAIIPWNIYLFYSDSKILEDNYENIRRYVEHIDKLYPGGLTDWGLGDWAPVKSKTPVALTSSAYYYADALILAKAAKVLNKNGDYEKYMALATKIKNAINQKYLDVTTGIYGSGFQTEQSIPLFWGIVPDSLKQKVASHLADAVAANGYHLDVGILGAKAILSALSDNGQAETAYKLASQTTAPSWGWWIINGATTLYENWNIEAKRDLSLNHIMFGEIGAWLFKGLGGIKPDENNPGFKNVILEPSFVAGLNHFTAEHEGPYGKIIASWKRQRNTVIYKVIIPANSTATVKFTDSAKVINNGKIAGGGNNDVTIGSGTHEFTVIPIAHP